MHLSFSASPAYRPTPPMLAKTLDVVVHNVQRTKSAVLSSCSELSTLLLDFFRQLLGLVQYLDNFCQVRNCIASMTHKK